MDGKEIQWKLNNHSLIWHIDFQPGQTHDFLITYGASGSDSYYFNFSQSREILDFNFTIHLNTGNFRVVSSIVDDSIKLAAHRSATENYVNWKIDQILALPTIGVFFTQGWQYAPNEQTIATLNLSARASLLFLILAVFTLIIFKTEIRLQDIALLAAVYLLPSLILFAGGMSHFPQFSPDKIGHLQVQIFAMLSLLPAGLAFLIFREAPKLPATILVILITAAGCYPLLGILEEQQRIAAETTIQAGMIAYIFLATLYARLSKYHGNQG